MIGRKRVKLTWNEKEGVGYLKLPNHPGRGVAGCSKRTVDMRDLDASLGGPQLIFDVDEHDRVIGIEILSWDEATG